MLFAMLLWLSLDFFDELELVSHRKYLSRLQGHPSTQFFPEVMNSSGSLGQGLSVASGFALGQKAQKNNPIFLCLCLMESARKE